MGNEDGKIIIGTEVDTTNLDDAIQDITKIKVDDVDIEIKPNMDTKDIDKYLDIINKKLKEMQDKRSTYYDYPAKEDVLSVIPLSDEEERYYDELWNVAHDLYAQKQSMLKTDKDIAYEMQKQAEAAAKQQAEAEKQAVVTKLTEASNRINSDELLQMQSELEEMVRSYNDLTKSRILSSDDLQYAEKLKQDIMDLASEIERVSGSKLSIKGITDIERNFNDVRKSVDRVGNAVERVTRKIGHTVLAVFGIRSAFMFVRNAISTISNDDEQLKADIDYMKTALAYTLEPIVRTIVNWAKQLMFYIGYIVKALTGKNIFANANKGLQKATSGAKALNKELNKTIAGFDEMNVLNDNSSSGGSGGGGATPSFDLTKGLEGDVPKWLQWIVDHKDEVIAGLAGITAGLIALKLGATPLQALGIGIAVYGLVKGIRDLKKFLKDKTFGNFIKVLEDIAIVVGGIAIAFGAWPVAAGAAIALVVVELVKHFDKIKKLFDDLIKWMDVNVLGKLRQLFGPLGDILYLPIKFFVELARSAFENFFGNVKQVIQGVIQIFKGDFKGGIATIFDGLIGILISPFKSLITAVKAVWGQVQSSVNYWKDQFRATANNIAYTMVAPIDNFVNSVKGIWGRVKQAISDLVTNINNKLDKINPIKIGQNAGSKIKNLFGFAHGGVIKLASGGIINQPGRGIPVTSAIAGERGAEGIVPLTDSQQMALLGEAIGKYINLSATIPVYVGNRQIVREIKKIDAENSFASNR